MRLRNTQKKKIIRRSVSLVAALAMLLNETYIWSIIDSVPFLETNDNKSEFTAYAAEDSGDDPEFQHDNETTKEITIPLENFKEYSDACQVYSTYHQYDKITIYSTGTSDLFESGFAGLGTVNKPFAGSIAISANTDITLNLDAPLFNYVYDSVTINNNTALPISRYYLVNGGADETTPIVAKYVYHDSSNSDLVTWSIDLTTPSDSTDHYLSQFGGFIGIMDDDKGIPKLALNVTMNTASLTKDDVIKDDNGAVGIIGSGDLGLACGHMDAGAELTFTYTANRALSIIETSGGDVGGLVGEMESGAVFTLKNENAVTSGIDITTSAGSSYAGGLVGKNVGGTVVVKDSSDATAVYPVTQHITGTSGAGGVYGYYQPVEALISATVHNDETGEDETVDKSFDTSKFNINCQVNGSGYTGGLFGTLDTAYNVTINGSGTVTVNHNSGNCTGYGGLIGQYKADSVERTLSISSVTAQSSKAGTAIYYGGGIGVIEPTTPTYVEFSSFTSNASNAGSLTFGGLVASADKAFVKSTASKIAASGYKGGGLVGSLKDGVLQISGANTITGSSADPGDKEDLKVGRFVGYRDNGLVFMDTGTSCTCGAAEVDDIGAWGGVVKLDGFTTPANVLSVSGHAVTIGTSSYAFTPITNADDFAVTALRFQIDGSESETGNPFVSFANTTKNSSTIASTGVSLSGDVVLTGTGIYGLTRDNDIGSDMAKCVYNNTFSGGSKTVTFDTGTIYRHKYNGLFAKLNGGTVQNVTFAGNITVNAKTDMYVGSAAAKATGDFTANSVTINTSMPYSGSSTLYIGGILGEAEGGTDSSIGTIYVIGCTVKANITGSNSSAVLGGVIGQISHKADENRTWTFTTVNVSGTISNESSGKMGGLVAVIYGGYNGNSNHRVLTLNGVTIDGLTVSGSDADSMGGLLGYSWLKTDTNVTSVTVQDNSSDSSKKPTVSNGDAGGIGGMIYRATGKWTVTSLDIKNIVVSGTGSVGMIVNKGISNDDSKFYTEASRSAIYLCLPEDYIYNITSSSITSGSVFDELCAYTAPDAAGVLKNGNGIISINTTFKTDGSTASGSYHARTAKGASVNSYSRYYYNLDTLSPSSTEWSTYQTALTAYEAYEALSEEEKAAYGTAPTEPSVPNGSDELMSWGLNQYACTNLKQYFADVFGSSIPDETYDLENYSWYPVDLDKNITVNGTFKFYSYEFELSEDAKKTAEDTQDTTAGRTSAETKLAYDRTNLENNQHYTMHCGLFRNVASGKTLTIGTTVFEGDVGLFGTGDNTNSGALICGTVQGASNTSKATVQVYDTGSISLNGVYVYGVTTGNSPNYAPLLINKVGSYVNLTVKNVTSTGYLMASYSTNSPYMEKDSSNYPKAASSLIGNVGLSDSPTGINVNFSNIKLDGRKTAVASPYDSQLTGVYGSDLTIFTRSTLLNQFKYATGSTGTYNYTSDEDWSSGSHAGHGVTYGKEAGYTSSDTDTEYPGKEQKYSGTSGYYTSPDTPAAGTAYSGFKTGFIPYVYVPYNSTNKTHQLRVNHEASTATGCGTYNDPYILSDGYKLEAFSYWINTGFTNNDSILIPSDTNHLTISNGAITAINGTWCTDKTAHATFTYSSATEKFTGTISSTNYTIDPDVMQTYLAGAYYKIPDEVSEITIPTTGENHKYDFEGLGNTSANSAVFRGVIDGNGKNLINNTTHPLIERSNGSVVKDLTIEVKPATDISLNGTSYTFDSAVVGEDANAAYGAVMAKIFGGDNIIDNVSLTFGTSSTNKANIAIGGTAQLVPVGGYVGVIVNGGLYFRNMKRIDENNSEILYDKSLFDNVTFSATANGETDTDPMSDSNMEWLYVNPIVGRVINGFAVTESYEIKKTINNVETTIQKNAYRPYENGTRTYKGGTTDDVRYWDEANQTELTTVPASISHVTMQNGNKHYSIVDISSALGKLNTSGTDANVEVPNGQALFVMSAIVNSGMSNQSLGYSSNAVGSSNNYYVSRSNAEYNYVGKIPGSTEANYATAIADYNKAATDGTAISGYLMTEYTTGATDISGTNNKTVKLTTEGGKYYLPDGFKGIGNMYHDDDIYRMKITNFDGNGATVSMNSSWYFYYADPGNNNALTKFDTAYAHYPMVGFGLINYQTGKTYDESNRFYNFILTGNVVADCINSNSNVGNHITYIGGLSSGNWTGKYNDTDVEYADSNYMPAVGSLIGYATNTTYTDSVALQNVYVKGLRNTGGLIGMTSLTTFTSDTSDPKFTYENTKSTPSNKIKVHGAATTGGMIGKNQQSIVYIDNGNATYSLTEVKSECTKVNNNQQNYGVGGFVGMCRAADSSKVNRAITVKRVTVGSPTQDSPSEISATADKIGVGGVVGTITRAKVSIEECYVYNQSIKSAYSSGGMIGYWATPTDGSDITSVTIYAKDYGSADKNPVITSSASGGAAGGFIGNRLNENAGVSVYIRNSNVSGYTIGGTALSNAGGAIGEWNGGTVNLQNVDISSCKIIAKSSGGYAGGLVGSQQTNNNANQNSILGYNILLKNLDFTGQYKGNILGRNTNNNQVIKLSGFSRQDDQETSTMIPALVGSPNASKPYGTGGYVIFADYTDEASTVQNKKFANMVMSDKDIAEYEVIGSRTTITDYKVITKKDASGNSVVQSYSYNTRSNTFSDTVSPESVSASGTKTSYETIDASTNLTQVTSVSELTAANAGGFYIRSESTNNSRKHKYITSNVINGTYNADGTIKGNKPVLQLSPTADDLTGAAEWYFELVSTNEDSNLNTYRMYTYVNGVKRYFSRMHSKGGYIYIYSETELVSTPTDNLFYITSTDTVENGFNITLTSNSNNAAYKYFCYADAGYAIWNSVSDSSDVLTIWKETTTNASYNLISEDYSSSAFAPVQGEAITGTLTDKTDATAAQAETYVEDLGDLDNSDHSYEVYTVTVTAVKNVYGYTDNSKPYVTTNPKRFITDDSQFLTGDGVLSALYVSSAFKKITDDRADSTNKPKAYTAYSLERYIGETTDEEALARIRTELSNSSTEFKNYSGYENSGIKNFTLLVAEDTNKETLTPLINNYLRTLTNTGYNYADTTNTAIYDVGMYRCVFNESTKDFDVYTSDVCLKKTHVGTSYYFYMEAKEVDTQDLPQFTLMDVKFKDPSGSGKIAYHLYVPVYVKKVLRYNFNAEIKSGSDYYWTAYKKLGEDMTRQGLFENLGNPVTIAFEYEYDRTGTDWKDAVNGGDSLLTNYYKSLTLKNHNNNGWATNTKMVLVDANNSDKYYYLDTPPTATPTTISLYDFTDESGQHYSPVPFQDMMTVTVSQDNNGTLTPTTGNTAAGATVLYNNTYYRPITDSDTSLDDEDKFSVTEVTNIQKERYYLSIFTKADSSNTNIYRYEISSPESFGSTGSGVMTSGTWTVHDWRSNRINKNTVINLFTGKLYENNLTLNVTPRSSGTPVMSATNNYLTVDMKATVSLTSSAVSSGVGVNMLTFQNNADIYQTFLMMYDKLATVGGSHEIGIDTVANAKVGINSYYYTGGNISAVLTSSNATAVDNPQGKKVELAKYIELGNKQNLISLIGSSSNSYAATLQVNFDMVYATDDLSTQFPKRDTSVPAQSVIGANVIGYSKISSTAEGAANSATYDKKTDTELYYTTSESTATLRYNVEETPKNAAGRYSYLGINSVETGDDEVFVDTYAVYDTHKLTNAGNYIEFTLTLSNKGDGYVTPVVGNPIPTGTGAGTALTISDYITELQIFGKDTDGDEKDNVIFEQSATAVSSETIVTTKGDKLYTVRVRKDLLKTQADGIYLIPIKFKVKTGNTKFNSFGLEYSNYKVSLTAATYSTISSTDYSKTSYAFDHIIYTNARVLTSVVN